jgi:hypothetical protein
MKSSKSAAKVFIGIIVFCCLTLTRSAKNEDLMPAADEAHSAKALRKNAPPSFTSTLGGFSMQLPKKWHAVEAMNEDGYLGVFSPENLKDVNAEYTYGLKVVRLQDYTKKSQIEQDDINLKALEYAKSVCKETDPNFQGPDVAAKWGSEEAPTNIFVFRVFKDKPKECKGLTILVRIRNKGLIYALWRIPCSKQEKLLSEALQISGTVEINETWEPTKL